MAGPQLRAEFFVAPDGSVRRRAPPLPRPVARAVFDRSGRRCALCGCTVRFGGRARDFSPMDEYAVRPAHIDHILPRARGGSNDPTNLRVLCFRCNTERGARA